jgi:hypothetical protein
MINILPRELIKEILTYTIKDYFITVRQINFLFKIISDEIQTEQGIVLVITSANMVRSLDLFPSFKKELRGDYLSYFYHTSVSSGVKTYNYEFGLKKYYTFNPNNKRGKILGFEYATLKSQVIDDFGYYPNNVLNKPTLSPTSSLIKILLNQHPLSDRDAFIKTSLRKTLEYYRISIQNDPLIPFDKRPDIMRLYQEAF